MIRRSRLWLFLALLPNVAFAQYPQPQLLSGQTPQGIPPSSMTAQATDVLDAADVGNAFDFNASIGFSRTQRFAKITRENVVNGTTQFADELSFGDVRQQLDIRAALSLYHDLELNFYLPYVITQDGSLDYAANVSATNSSVTTDPTTGGPLFSVPYRSFKSGLEHLYVGAAWSPLNDSRDDTKPTWTLRFTYGIPLGAAFRPDRNDPTNSTRRAPVSDRTHRLRWETSLSKRLGYLDPYFSMHVMLPLADGSIRNLNPAINAGFYTGFEIVPWDVPDKRQRVSLDFRFGGAYVGPGRQYSELSDALRQLTATENYAQVYTGFHFLLQAVEYVRFTAGVTLAHDTPHMLTTESVGNDRDGNGRVDLDNAAEVNPLHVDAFDRPGRRFRVENMVNVSFYVGLAITL